MSRILRRNGDARGNAVRHIEMGNRCLLRRVASRIPGLRRAYVLLRALPAETRNQLDILRLAVLSRKAFQGDPNSDVIVSLTSFPARIKHAWIPIETMFHQERPPRKVVLVLAADEFPGKRLPRSIRKQQARGLEILWVERNTRSYKKLLPTRKAYPDATIVTIDDDILYGPCMLSGLLAAAKDHPGAIVGHRGWVVSDNGSALIPYVQWSEADRSTPSERTFLTSGAGTLFPPKLLPDELLLDIDLAERLCPMADDIWFWAVARKADVPMVCLGNHSLRELGQQRGSPALSDMNWREGQQNDLQLKRVIDHFGLMNGCFAAKTHSCHVSPVQT